jgi:hypothetical protein
VHSDTVGIIRSEGERLLKAVRKELFMNLSGTKARSDITGIYADHRELLEPGLFKSFTESGSGEETRGKRLLSSFLADCFLGGNNSTIRDRILTLEAGGEFTAAGKNITIRTMNAWIISEPKKDKRDEIERGGAEMLNKLTPLYLQYLERLSEYSETLGRSSYENLMEYVSEEGLTGLRYEAASFLNDTDYVAGDMLNWFFLKKMEHRPKDASFSDVMYLLNSAELRGYFPKIDFTVFPMNVLDQMGLIPPGDIKLDKEKRKGKSTDAFSIPVNPPSECSTSIYPLGGIHDYESILGALGRCSCFVFTEPDDDFEFKFLRDETLTRIFSALFEGLVYEPRWFRKYLRLETDKNLLDFLSLRRLMSARLDAGRVLCACEAYSGGETGELPATFSDILSSAAKCKYDGRGFLPELLSPVHSPLHFQAALAIPGLRLFMKEAYDEEWWRTGAAGDFLRGIWTEGGRVTAESFLTRCNCSKPDSGMLVRNFEEALG